MILNNLFTQSLFEAADPSRLIVSITIQPMSSGGEPMQKEIDLTGQFQGSTASQMNQAMDYMSKMLESKGLAFNDLSVSYQGHTINGQNRGAMAPQSDWEKEAEAKAAQMRAQRPKQNATPAIKESKSNHITQFASNAHEEWRRNFDPTGTKPRIKKNSDGTEGDINVPFADLHPDWQKENLAAAHAAHRAVKHFGRDMEKAAEYVHNEWMKRNPRADYNAAQHVPYDDLPEDEKEKDRVHVRTMMQLMGHRPEQGVAEDATSDLLNMRRDDPRVQQNQDINDLAKEIYSQMVAERGQPMDRGQQNNWVAIAQTKAAAKLQQSTPQTQTQNNVPALKPFPREQPETPSFIKKSSTQWESQGVAEARMSAAQRLWNAEQKQRAKSDASLARTPSSIPKKQEPVDQDKQVAAKVDESRRARQSLMARIVNSR